MALIKCKECGKEISDTAKTCPHCNYIIHKNKTKIIISITLIVIIIIAGIIGTAYINVSTNKHKKNENYAEVSKDIFPFEAVKTKEQFFDIIYEENNLVLAVRDTCEYSKMFSPIIQEISNTYNLKVYTLNADALDNINLNDKNTGKIIEISATPTIYFKNYEEELDMLEGYMERKN